MLEHEFYPTPLNIINQMLDAIDIKWKGTVLEPSAGAGAILDAIANRRSSRYNEPDKSELFAIELDTDLRYTLQGKGYKVLGTNFLDYDEPLTFDYIVMNPPFSRGVDHVLKAWEHVKDGGKLCALVNAETVRSQHTKTRQLLGNIITEYGGFVYLGSCFANAERPTDVEVAMITLEKPTKESVNYFQDFQFDLDQEVAHSEHNPNTLASKDIVRDLVARYNAARKILLDRYESQSKLDFYLQGIEPPVAKYSRRSSSELPVLNSPASIEEQLAQLKSRFWATVFEKTEIGKKATSNFLSKFNDFRTHQSSMAFTEDNVKEVLFLFVCNIKEMMRDSVIEVFDMATKYHEKNIIHVEGWKTNKSWKLNKRIIMPSVVAYGASCGFSFFEYRSEFLDDLDKVVSYLSGHPLIPEQQVKSCLRKFCYSHDYPNPFETQFFIVKVFKKGTIHVDFKPEYLEVLKQINLIASEGKNWIGQGC